MGVRIEERKQITGFLKTK